MELSVLLVEDDPADLKQFQRDFPDYFLKRDITVHLDSKSDFDAAFAAIRNPHSRYDLVISDTYKGDHANRNAAVLGMVAEYRQGRFAPLIVCSSAPQPHSLNPSAFVTWADKSQPGDIERAILATLDRGIPQIARALRNEIDNAAGTFLWKFLEANWARLVGNIDRAQLERIIRRRTALMISDLIPGTDPVAPLESRHGLEYYVYPCFEQDYFSLGDIIQDKKTGEFRVILTPHCLLTTKPARPVPKAELVLTIRTTLAQAIIGKAKLDSARIENNDAQLKRLGKWARNDVGAIPEGRYWYLPQFLEIPHLYCDFLRLETVEQTRLKAEFQRVATLTPPYAEALQECFAGFYGSVGIPDIDARSIISLLAEPAKP
jgi:hypothetical protein